MDSSGEQTANKNLPNIGGQDAVVHQTGAMVDHSVPVRGAANTPTRTDRNSDASLCSADSCIRGVPTHHHAKSGQGSGDRVPGGGEAAVPSSLDPYKNNRNHRESDQFDRNSQEYAISRTRERFSLTNALGRKKYCGQWVVAANNPDGSTCVIRVNCKCWDCPYCGPRKAKRVKRAIRITAEAHDLSRFVTLTLDPSKGGDEDTVAFINSTFAKWRVSLRRKFGSGIKYIRILEFQKNGNAHLHILLDRYLPQRWIMNSWTAVGGGRVVYVKYVDINQVSHYLAKYLTKELLLSAPLRSRRVTTSRGIHLFEKQTSELVWVLLKTSIFLLYQRFHLQCTKFTLDTEGVLDSFEYAFDLAA